MTERGRVWVPLSHGIYIGILFLFFYSCMTEKKNSCTLYAIISGVDTNESPTPPFNNFFSTPIKGEHIGP